MSPLSLAPDPSAAPEKPGDNTAEPTSRKDSTHMATAPKIPNGANLTHTIETGLTTELGVALRDFFDPDVYDTTALAKYLVKSGNLVSTVRTQLLDADLDTFRKK